MEEEEDEREEEEDTREQCQQSGVGETDSVMVTRWEMGLLSIFNFTHIFKITVRKILWTTFNFLVTVPPSLLVNSPILVTNGQLSH